MQKKQKNYLGNKKFIFRKNNPLHSKYIEEKKETKMKINNQNRYLYKSKKLKKGVFLKKPKLNEILYPFFLNMKLINEYLKKK